MHTVRLLVLPFLLIALLGCERAPGTLQAPTQPTAPLAGALTQPAPTAIAQSTSAPVTAPFIAGGQVLSVESVKSLLQLSQLFTFKDGTLDGQPATIVELTPTGVSTFPAVAAGFSAQLVGDANTLNRIRLTVPRSDQADSLNQGQGVVTVFLAGLFAPDVLAPIRPWLTLNYSTLPVAGKQQTMLKNMQFTLERTSSSMVLEIVPVK